MNSNTYIMEYHSAEKKNGLLMQQLGWTSGTTVSEKSKSQKSQFVSHAPKDKTIIMKKKTVLAGVGVGRRVWLQVI